MTERKVKSPHSSVRTVTDGRTEWQIQELGWVEAIDSSNNNPALTAPVTSSGEKVGVIYRDMRTDAIVICLTRAPENSLFCGGAILRIAEELIRPENPRGKSRRQAVKLES